ncbi:transglutaminase-like domain-containing protein [Beggiatoa leptomitoformis]|uniref:Transglutaminase-like domain-containing protein n=1 Tax=Beggiatoa leptomitoformis TaxID=288004 RepID=A0A2N9YE12_9GAMM|nr:transglutaminase domain-containing protein [Beggiatoa leptomitoformis]ALG68895.1 hypothetical protein AL038_15820 [Beggiatoa leptomitoformis]AUI68731.1 hypothetical protein BLE401_08440 [Beggiatoa leptomitoformis]
MQKSPPPFLLGMSLLFWGWQSHLLLLAIPMALIIEGVRWVNWRWDLSDKEFNRLSDLTSFLWIGLAIYLFSRESIHGLFTLLNWLPPLFFLLLGAQRYSSVGSIRVSSLFVSMRRVDDKKPPAEVLRFNLCYPYIMLCLLAASTERSSGFFIGMFCLISWGLWYVRPTHYATKKWVVLLIMIGTLGFLGQLGLYQLQQEIEKLVIQWFEYDLLADRDPYRQTTAIGDIQELKQSERILLRVDASYPLLLREASYNLYIGSTWRAQSLSFNKLENVPQVKNTWTFLEDKTLPKTQETIKIAGYTRYGKGILSLPIGTFQVEQLPALNVEYNRYGAVRVSEVPEWVDYITHYTTTSTVLDSPPTDSDLSIPATEIDVLKKLARDLGLKKQSPEQAIATVTRFFTNKFTYTLKRDKTKRLNETALADFLLTQRQGHCEYFATATTLLLRAAGIPTRYAAGFAVEEYNEFENRYVVRQRHAHAWTLVYLNGAWQDLDTTPADWTVLETAQMPWWQTVNDLGSWLWFQFSAWRWQETTTSEHWFGWLLLPLFIMLIWRLTTKNRVKHQAASTPAKTTETKVDKGADSAFYQVITYLQQQGYERQTGETPRNWFKRLQHPALQTAEMDALLLLHERYRFDPNTITYSEKQQLEKAVSQWLQACLNADLLKIQTRLDA